MTATATTIKRTIDERFHDWISNGVLWAAVGCWLAEALMNAYFGYRTAGPLLGLLLVGIAIFGAHCSVKVFAIRGMDKWAWTWRTVYAIPLLVCLIVSQVGGWFALGTWLADGFTARATQASSRETAADDVERLRAEQKKIGVPRDIGSIEADLDLELRRTSKQFPKGDGPKATLLRGELSAAKRYHALPGLIADAQDKLASAPQIAAGTPHLEVLKRIFTGAEEKNIAFWVPVALTGIIGFFANFGFPLAGIGRDELAAAPRPAHALPPPDIFDAYKGYDAYHPHARRASPYGGAYRHELAHPEYPDHPVYRSHETAGRPVSHAQPQPPTHSPEHHGQLVVVPPSAPAAAPNNNPITINVGGATQHGAPGLPGAGAAGRRLVKRSSGEGQTGNASAPAGRDLAPSRGTSPSPAAAGRPVDRDHITQVIDHIATFHAAEVIPDDGALVTLADMVEHYRTWAKGRAIDPAAFVSMYPVVTGVQRVDISGAQHFWGVRLRHQLKVVGAQ